MHTSRAPIGVTLFSLIASLALGLGLLLSLRRPVLLEAAGQAFEVASVKYAGIDALVRPPRVVAWETVRSGSALRVGEVVRTGAGSSGFHAIAFDRSEIWLGENALLSVEGTKEDIGLSIKQGRMVISGTPSFTVSALGRQLRLRGGTMYAEVTPGLKSMLVSVVKGTVMVSEESQSSKTIQLTEGESIEIGEEGEARTVVKHTVALDSPAEAEVVFSGDDSSSIPLRWTAAVPAILDWEVATDAEFTKIVQSGRSHNGTAVAVIGEGTFYWRIKGENAASSRKGRFVVSVVRGLRPTWPPDGAKIASGTFGDVMRFEWQVGDSNFVDGVSYAIEVAPDAEFTTPKVISGKLHKSAETFALTVDERELSAAQKPGNDSLYWRVVARGNAGKTVTSSVVFKLGHETARKIEAPVAHMPSDGADIPIGKKPVRFSWGPVPAAAEYRLYVWASDAMRSPEPTVVTTENFALVPSAQLPMDTSGLSWTVVAVGSHGETGGFARNRRLRAISASPPLAPERKEPAHGQQWRMSGSDGLRMKWAKVSGGKSYNVEIQRRVSETEWAIAFRKSFDGDRVEMDWSAEKPGSYRWSVEAVDELGRASASGEFNEFEVLSAAKRLSAPRVPASN